MLNPASALLVTPTRMAPAGMAVLRQAALLQEFFYLVVAIGVGCGSRADSQQQCQGHAQLCPQMPQGPNFQIAKPRACCMA